MMEGEEGAPTEDIIEASKEVHDGRPPLRNFEAMDHIHERMRNRAEEGLTKLEPLIKK